MEKTPAGEELDREAPRQGRRGGEDAGREGMGRGGALVEAEDADGIPADAGAGPGPLTRERVRELSERLDGLIEEFRRRNVELGAVSGLMLAAVVVGLGLDGGGTAYFWLAPVAFLAGVGLSWAAGRWRLRKLPPPASEAAPSLDAELGALRERFEAFLSSPGELFSTMMKLMAGMGVLMGIASVVVGVGLWSFGETSFAIGTMVGGVGFSLTSLPMYRFAKHYDRAGALGREISALSRERDRSLGRGDSVALGERLALENELDELRSARKKWLQAAAAAGGTSVAYPFLMGEVEAPGDLVGHVVFAVVFVGLLLIPIIRKQFRMRELAGRLEGLDEEEGSGGPRVREEDRPAVALEGSARRPEEEMP